MTEPRLKGADDVPFFDYINIPSSLETMALCTVIRRIWLRYDIDLIDASINPWQPDYTQVRKRVLEDLRKLDLPGTVLDKLNYFSSVFEKELIEIANYLAYFDVNLKSCLDLQWTNWGTIDRSKTALEIVHSGKYIPDNQKKSVLYNYFVFESVESKDPSMSPHVSHYDKYSFCISVQIGNEAQCRYYLKKFPHDKKDVLIIKGVKSIQEVSSRNRSLRNCFCLLFFNMSKKKLLIDTISKNEFMVTWLLSWPWNIFFEKYLEENYLEYFRKASQIHMLREKDYLLFERLSKNVLIQKHFAKLVSG